MNMDLDLNKFSLSLEQTEILYILEMHKTLNDIQKSNKDIALKRKWLNDWKKQIKNNFASFTGNEGATLHWYSIQELHKIVSDSSPDLPWFRLVLLEAMLFVPYYALNSTEEKADSKTEKRNNILETSSFKYNISDGDEFLENYFTEKFYKKGYISRLRKCHNKVIKELKPIITIKKVAITAVITSVVIILAATQKDNIAKLLVGSNFSGLKGAALTSACLAYLGGGAVMAGGTGMAGGTTVIVGGSSILGILLGASVCSSIETFEVIKEEDVIMQTAKLMVSIREIFLNDEHDVRYSTAILEKYTDIKSDLEKELYKLSNNTNITKKELNKQINNLNGIIKIMNNAEKSMNKFISSFCIGESAIHSF